MKNILLIILVSFSALSIMQQSSQPARETSPVACAPSRNDELFPDENGKYITVLPGWGNHQYRVSTKNDSAQFYFNQGLNLYYSYHLRQSLASFRESARFDEGLAMAYWGQALASGPFYNEPVYRMNRTVPAIISEMKKHADGATKTEQDLLAAMELRFSNDITNSDRAELDRNYANALYKLIAEHPEDNEIKALHIDAIMLQHKWDFWNQDGSPKTWTAGVVKLCEEIMRSDSLHPAALHYYIHLTEASRQPGLALHGADLLKESMPGTSHMVHMASHMYQRNGLFAEGVFVNEKANTVSNIADSISPASGNGQNTTMHYFAVQSFCALSAGMYERAMPVYSRARTRAVELNGSLKNLTYLQFVYMMPVMAALRMGKWHDILSAKPVDREWKYAAILEDFSVGLASIRTKNLSKAEACIKQIAENLDDSLLQIRRVPFNKPVQGARIALHLLQAELHAAKKDRINAEENYRLAIREEDSLIYSEPQDWLLPVRQYYGKYLLDNGEKSRAEKIYREDLVLHPGNGWSQVGLRNCLQHTAKKAEAKKLGLLIQKSFSNADEIPPASVY